jgi:hypothetical protein
VNAHLELGNVTGPGDPAWYQCWQSHIDFEWTQSAGVSRTTSTVNYYTQVKYSTNSNPLVTTLCDGVPRVLEARDTPIVVTMTDGSAEVRSALPATPTPAPTCWIQQEYCSTLRSVFSQITPSLSSSYSSRVSSMKAQSSNWRAPRLAIYSLTPPCREETTCGTYCELQGYQVTL